MAANVVITLLRHGRTLDNQASRYSGWIDSQLSEAGMNEIDQVKQQYEDEKTFLQAIDCIYTSDLKRTIQTSTLLFSDQYPLRSVKNLREMHFGDFEGLSYEELKNDKRYQAWLNDLFIYKIPNGESFIQFTDRIDCAFKAIKKDMHEKKLKHIILITHGGVIRYLLTKLTNESRSFFDWEVPYAQGYQLIWSHQAFKEDKPCMSLQAVPITGNGNS